MEIALYRSRFELPFRSRRFERDPIGPYALFDPNALDGWMCVHQEFGTQCIDLDLPLKHAIDHWTMPMLLGLRNIKRRRAMAHVSLILDFEHRTMRAPKYGVYVQITTMPSSFTNQGLPIVAENGKPILKPLWVDNSGGNAPLSLYRKSIDPKSHDPDFWTEFFLTELRKTRK